MSGKLTMIFDPGEGEKPRIMCVDLDDYVVSRIRHCPPPSPFPSPGHGHVNPLTGCIDTMSDREFRKDLFINAAKRLGTLLAERMADAEGWADASRIDPARQQLDTGEPHQ